MGEGHTLNWLPKKAKLNLRGQECETAGLVERQGVQADEQSRDLRTDRVCRRIPIGLASVRTHSRSSAQYLGA